MTISPEEERDVPIGPQMDSWYEIPTVVVMPHILAQSDTDREIEPLEWKICKGLIKKLIRPECIHIEGALPIRGEGYENEEIHILSSDTPDEILVFTLDNRYGVQHVRFSLRNTQQLDTPVKENETYRSERIHNFLEEVIMDEVIMWSDKNGNLQISLRPPMFTNAHRVFVTDVTMMHYVGVRIEMNKYFDIDQTNPIPLEGDIQLLVPYECKDGTMPDLP